VSSGHYTRVKYDTLSEFIFVTLQNPIFCVKIVPDCGGNGLCFEF
jgi:hypothetical protein